MRTAKRERPQRLLGRAYRFMLAHSKPLCAHLDHGRTRIDANLVEKAIRLSYFGKKFRGRRPTRPVAQRAGTLAVHRRPPERANGPPCSTR
ncbi:hypothetical protein ASA1KI_10450 [Opitutales bacterium ASA1]|nr:hypothetical protein ASA1KI_10450 [Opitutales bacterium ASA1]